MAAGVVSAWLPDPKRPGNEWLAGAYSAVVAVLAAVDVVVDRVDFATVEAAVAAAVSAPAMLLARYRSVGAETHRQALECDV